MADDRLHRIEDKLDSVNDRLSNIDRTLAAQHVSLKEHMRRSLALEAQIEPLKKHADMTAGAIKLLSTLAVVATIISAIMMWFARK